MNESVKCPAKLECAHADTCLPDYWGGHHLPHVSIIVRRGMTLKEVKSQLHSELDMGFIAGNDPMTQDDSGPEGDRWFKKAHAAINRMTLVNPRRRLFLDLEESDDDDDDDNAVYAFFVFVPVE